MDALSLRRKNIHDTNNNANDINNERELYDEFKLSKDYGIIMLKLALILLVGAIGYVLISKLVLWISIVIWIVYFVKFTVTFRFDKYKINTNN